MMFFLLFLVVLKVTLSLDFQGTYDDDSYENGEIRFCRDGDNVFGTYTWGAEGGYIVGITRGTVDANGVLTCKWYEAGISMGGCNATVDESGNIEGFWWFNEKDSFDQFLHPWNCLQTDAARPVDTGDDDQCLIVGTPSVVPSGSWDTTNKICTDGPNLMAYDSAIGVQMYGYYYSDDYIVSGTWFDGTDHGSYMVLLMDGADARLFVYDDTDLYGCTNMTISQTSSSSPNPYADCKNRDWDGTNNDQRWSGKFPDDYYGAGQFSYLLNINGKLTGAYQNEDNPFGIFLGDVSATGDYAEGYWYEASWVQEAWGKFNLSVSADTLDYTGTWGYEEDDPTELWCTSAPINSHFTNEDYAISPDLIPDNNVVGPAEWFCASPEDDPEVNYPWSFCEDSSEDLDLSASYFGDIGYFKGKYFSNNLVGVGIFAEDGYEGDTAKYYGSFLYVATRNGGMTGWYMSIEDPTAYPIVYTEYVRDGPYVYNQEVTGTAVCDANERSVPMYPPDIPPAEPVVDLGVKASCGLMLVFLVCLFF